MSKEYIGGPIEGGDGAQRYQRPATGNYLELMPAIVAGSAFDDDNREDYSSGRRSPDWQPELLRWLATLNPGRTQTEYQKAVRYFFETPGVPPCVADLTFDLLLAYRGALAHRATAHGRNAGRQTASGSRANLTLQGASHAQLASGIQLDDVHATSKDKGNASEQATTALSPATVNIRLTALRQFLVHCSLMGSVPQLTPDRIRTALKRMRIERRRPYQILAEQEWADFLAAARLPLDRAPVPQPSDSDAPPANTEENKAHERKQAERSPWGTPRALRPPAQASAKIEDGQSASADTRTLPRSRAGLTGRYTAQRDYALVSLALATGLRAIELTELDVGDLVREWQGGIAEWWLVLPDAKTKGQRGGRTLPLVPSLVEILLTYIASTGRRWEREEDRNTPLFRTGRRGAGGKQQRRAARDGGRLSPQQVRAIVDRIETQWLALREASAASSNMLATGETRKISPHALRHSTAIALLSGNDDTDRPPASVEHVRGWLGHFDIRTTQGYLAHLDARRHRRPYALSVDAANQTTRPEYRETSTGEEG